MFSSIFSLIPSNLFNFFFHVLDIQFPERVKLKFVDKVPPLPTNIKAPKMQKRLDLMRGPELVNNFLMHRQYGIIVSLCFL
jgi:hypothetical protein